MKSKRMILSVIVILVCAVMLSGCKKPNFGVSVKDEKNATVEAVRASKEFFGGAGSIDVGEGEKIIIESGLEGKSEVSLKFSNDAALKMDAEMTELTEAISGENADLEIVVKGSGRTEYDLAPGVYFLSAKVIEKANGTILISVR